MTKPKISQGAGCLDCGSPAPLHNKGCSISSGAIKSAGKTVLWGNRQVGVWSPKKDFFIYRRIAEFARSKYDPPVELVQIIVKPWPPPAKPKKRRKQIVYGRRSFEGKYPFSPVKKRVK